jgi:hypothetical protein
MGTDRTSEIIAGIFRINVDRDHRGRFRGHEEMDGHYRGWHYHVESRAFTQDQIMTLLERCLLNHGAVKVELVKSQKSHLAIGNVERLPARVSCFEKDNLQSILWTSSFNGTLHVETNKDDTFKVGFVTKALLAYFCKDMTRYYSACHDFEKLLDRLERLQTVIKNA